MATNYVPKLGDTFDIVVTMPATLGPSPSTYTVLQAGAQADYSTAPIVTFDGRQEIPQLPKVSFTVACLYLENKPVATEDWELPGTATTHEITVDTHTLTGFLRALQFQSQDFGEGMKGIVVTPVITYAGERADNCSVA